jgi:hypothetical protein
MSMLRGLRPPSWTVVAITLSIAAVVYVATMGPEMISRSVYEGLYLGADPHDAVAAARRELERERADIADRLQRADLYEEFVPRTISDFRDGAPLSISWPEGLADPRPARARELLEHDMLRRRTGREIAIGLHAFVGRGSRRVSLLGEHDGTPFCVSLEGIPEGGLERAIFPSTRRVSADTRHSLLGGCTFVHLYGLPGPHVLELLRHRGVPLYQYSSDVDYSRIDPFSLTGLLLGPGYHSEMLAQRACLAGDLDVCAREFDVDEEAAGYPAVIEQERWRNRLVLGDRNLDLFGLMEGEFGSEAFQEFWTSTEPVPVAFESAFGTSAATWVQSMAARSARISGTVLRGGPLPNGTAFATTFGLAIASILLGALVAGRRKAG